MWSYGNEEKKSPFIANQNPNLSSAIDFCLFGSSYIARKSSYLWQLVLYIRV